MDIFWKIKRKLRKTMIARSENPRPPSYPFISGDTFRSLADHIYETGKDNPDGKNRSFDPIEVKNGEIVFVEAHLLENYFKEVHPRIQHPYKLITHNNDWNITEKELRFIDDKIIHWFAQNLLVAHPKATPIPIGLENGYFANAGYIPLFTKEPHPTGMRRPRILACFNVASNPKERRGAFASLSQCPTVDVGKKWHTQPQYVSIVKRYMFVASPPGNGEDCIRTWESMLLGSIPIVKRSVGIEYFDSLRLPLWIIDSWDELGRLSEYDLEEKYDLIMSKADRKPLQMDYWNDLIHSKK